MFKTFTKETTKRVAHFWQAGPSSRPNPEGQKNKKTKGPTRRPKMTLGLNLPNIYHKLTKNMLDYSNATNISTPVFLLSSHTWILLLLVQ